MGFLEYFGTKVALRVAEAAVEHRKDILATARCRIFMRQAKVRVAMSSLLSVQIGGKYVFVQNAHRPFEFGPFGGVIKHAKSGKGRLNQLEFEPHIIAGHEEDMDRDLRGFLRAHRFPDFMKWFASGVDRESDAVRREVCEECQEAFAGNGPEGTKVPSDLQISLVRTVHEGFRKPPGVEYYQYRLFQVFETGDQPETQAWARCMVECAKSHPKLLVASRDEVLRGRSGNRKIGTHASYLIQSTTRPSEPEPLPE